MYQSEEEDEILYEVEKILGVRYNEEKHKVQFLIKWKNYDSRCDNTWEQEENLECPILLKQFWDTLSIGADTKRLIYEGKKKEMMIPSIESQDVIYVDDDDDDDFTDDLFYPPQPKASQPVSVSQPKLNVCQQPDKHHVSRTREEKGKQRYQPPQQQQQQKQIHQLPENQKVIDRRQEKYSPSHQKSYSPEKRPRSSSSSSSTSFSSITSSSPSISISTLNSWNISPRARLEAEVNARIGKKKSEAPMQRRPIKNINIVSYKNRMLSESKGSLSSPTQTPIRKRPHSDDYLSIKASKTEEKQSSTSFADIDTLFNKIQDNKKDRYISRYD